ncbi:MAG TPA: diacylglycerol kinase [Clostridiaceae bacterium]|jgi:diacylglycerol kinase (ATP)|nr:diacylglycerol kinase [Clostridiaceae bacterium]HBF77584.1 diacylglycerol kinase [Clostridiaceae bacterium]HBG37939.1 diacylglycerol kinase [Clostridiaceae bacterium]HBN28341.1 diacylglycerol kinase [Clostridiaceae bacterium]HBX48008.1 diacylglycerol kinase [Clostridiaceae bacterium]
MKIKKLTDSFNYAIEGIIYAIRTQRNIRIDFAIAILVLILSLFFDFTKYEMLILFLTITLVIVLEMVNTAIEATLDVLANYYHPLAKIAKNVSAGAVLISAINAVVVGYLLFFDKLKPITKNVIFKIKQSDPTVVFICLIVVVIITIIIKAIYGEGTPLNGGMPSGHSAIAFAGATAISLLTNDALVITISYFLAFLVAQSRVEGKIHSIYEVTIGSILGVLITIFIFTLF